MNYLREIKAFYDWLVFNPLPTGAVALWHALMAINNKAAWAEEFTVANVVLQSMTGLSRQGLDKARNILTQKNLVHYKKGTGNKAGTYRINSVCKIVGTVVDTVVDTNGYTQLTQMDTHSRHSSGTLNKHKLKQNESSNSGCNSPPGAGNVGTPTSDDLKRVVHEYTSCGFGMLTSTKGEMLDGLIQDYSAEWVIAALKVGAEQNKHSISYVRGILENWRRSGGIQLDRPGAYAERNKYVKGARDNACRSGRPRLNKAAILAND